MKNITGKYYLGSNKYSFILYEKRFSETTQKEIYKNIGYFKNLEDVYIALVEKEIKHDLNILDNINKINEMIKELKTFTINYIDEKSCKTIK